MRFASGMGFDGYQDFKMQLAQSPARSSGSAVSSTAGQTSSKQAVRPHDRAAEYRVTGNGPRVSASSRSTACRAGVQ